MLTNFTRPVIIAHRGASIYAPENTLAAFKLAARQHADAIELDAKLCADGYVVVIHDQTVDRTTPGSGRVREMALAELRELDAGSHFDIAFHDERIPTLDEVFQTIGQQLLINIELTNYLSLTDELPDKVVSLVKAYGLSERVMFSSYNPIALARARRLLPETPIGLLALRGVRGIIPRSRLGRLLSYQALHSEVSDTTPKLVKRVHNWGCKVFAYIADRESDMLRLIENGVDGFITNDPVLAHQVLHSVSQ